MTQSTSRARASQAIIRSTQSQSISNLSGTELENLTIRLTNYILIKSISKLPIKRADLVKCCTDSNVKLFEIIFDGTKKYLKDVCSSFLWFLFADD